MIYLFMVRIVYSTKVLYIRVVFVSILNLEKIYKQKKTIKGLHFIDLRKEINIYSIEFFS